MLVLAYKQVQDFSMISEYHRPQTLDEALKLIARPEPRTHPLGGGTMLNRPTPKSYAVVDLQALNLSEVRKTGNYLEIGATATLQALYESVHIPPALRESIRLETNYNIRQVATVAGALVACDGRSSFATAMLALDAKLTLLPGEEEVTLGNLLPLLTTTTGYASPLQGKLITKITLPAQTKLAFQYIARAPDDRPIVCAAVAQWASGRTRVALGGHGRSPALAMDGPEPGGVEMAAQNAYQDAGDEWGSAEYRREMAGVLVRRCLVQIQDSK